MKIAIINTTARTSSIGKIAYGQYIKLQADGHDVHLFYGRNDDVQTESIHKIDTKAEILIHVFLARLTGLHGYYSTFATMRLLKKLQELKPDLVQLYNLHGYYINIGMLLKYLGKSNIPVVYSMLDEHPYLGRCCYSFDCNNFRDGCRNCSISKKAYPRTWFFRLAKKFNKDKLIAYKGLNNSCYVGPQWVVERANESNLLRGNRFYCVDEYVDTEILFRPKEHYQYVNKELINSEKKIVLSVAPYSDPRKGGKYFMQLAWMFREACEFQFVYIGMDVKGVISPPNCIVKGFVSIQEELAEYYSLADVFVCTSLADTMPNVCLDSLACGTPVIGFDNTGIPYVAEGTQGVFVESGNVGELAKQINKVQKKTSDVINACRKYAVSRYSPETYYQKMIQIYEEMKDKRKNE